MNSNTQENFKLEEFKQLRKDITQRDSSMTQLFLTGLVASVTLLSAISVFFFNMYTKYPSVDLCYFFLAPIIVIIPITSIIDSHRRDIRRMGSYIKVFYEDQGFGPTWETAHDQITLLDKEEGHDAVPLVLWALVIICCALFWYGLHLTTQLVISLHGIVPLFPIIVMVAMNINYTESKNDYFQANATKWQEIHRNFEKKTIDDKSKV